VYYCNFYALFEFTPVKDNETIVPSICTLFIVTGSDGIRFLTMLPGSIIFVVIPFLIGKSYLKHHLSQLINDLFKRTDKSCKLGNISFIQHHFSVVS